MGYGRFMVDYLLGSTSYEHDCLSDGTLYEYLIYAEVKRRSGEKAERHSHMRH